MATAHSAKPINDPRQIFRIGEWFYLASSTLGERVPKTRVLFLPAIVMIAFALELYLKCLIAIETEATPPSGHNLRRLFNKLTSKTQDKIRHYFDNPTEQGEINWREKMKNPPPHIPKEAFPSPYDFDSILDVSADAFVQLRYVFERKKAGWNAHYIVKCTRQVIVEIHPDWDKPEPNN